MSTGTELDNVGTGETSTPANADDSQTLIEFATEKIDEATERGVEWLIGKEDDPNDKGKIGELFNPEGSNKARADWTKRHGDRYKDFFRGTFNSHAYPQEILSASQPNAVAFYIMVRQSSTAANNDVRGTGSRSFSYGGSIDDRQRLDLEDVEFATEQNRSSADQAGQARLLKTAGALAGMGAAVTLTKGGGGFSGVLNKVGKVAMAGVGGTLLGNAASKLQQTDNSVTFLNAAIHLHVPQSIISAYQADWQSEDLGIAGALTNRRFNQTDATEIVELAGRGIIAGAADIPRAAGLGNASVGGAIEAQSKKLNNPFKEQLFKSIGFRKFSFQYQFSPKNESELYNVEEIIKLFKYHMHPELTPGNSFLTYPSEFAIQFLHYEPSDGYVMTNEHLPKISSCALTDVKITYGPDGSFQTIKDTLGAASEITMELSFTELETLTANRIASGY
jgi:hypothetical protein